MRLAIVTAVVLFAAGCSAYYDHYTSSADKEAAPIVNNINTTVVQEMPTETPAGVLTPQPEGPRPTEAEVESTSSDVELLTLEQSLALAFSNSRDFKFRKESLYLSVLDFTLTQHRYDWIPSGSIDGTVALDGNGSGVSTTTADASMTLALSKRLLSGGLFSVSGSARQLGAVNGPTTDTNDSSVSASFSQPLLAGSGVAARESLVQATRSLLYDARDFELFRQQQALSTIRTYYDLLRRRRRIDTAVRNVEQYTFLYDRSQALFEKGKMNLVDVFRAEEQMLQSQNDLNDQRAAYSFALDGFKIDLGLPTAAKVDVADTRIEPAIVTVDADAAVKTALSNRLDLITAREQLADSERKVLVARNALLPALDFIARASDGSASGDWLDYNAQDGSASAGLALVLPLDQKSERNAYKSSLVSLDRQRRAYSLSEDNVVLSVRETVRNLRQAEFTLVIQQRQLRDSKDRLDSAYLLVEKGELSNRDVVEAQTAVQSAENAYVDAQVSYLTSYIQLLKDMGTLHVDEQGHWH